MSRNAWTSLGAFGGYCLVVFLFFGLPIATHPGRVVVGSDFDPEIFIWFFAWWPHALAHGENPIVTHAVWAPTGYDLAWATAIPVLALAFSPLTALAGPVVTYNVVSILLPALSAWTAFLLCRYLTKRLWPSVAGGYLFGFSTYLLGHEQGHLNLVAVFLVPLVALVVLRYLDGELGRRRLALYLGVLLAAQVGISTEILATLTFALVTACAVAFWLVPARRERLRSLVVPAVGAYGIAALLAAPLVYYTLTDFTSGELGPTAEFVADPVNLVVPTPVTAVGGDAAKSISAHFPPNYLEQTSYIGLPLLAILVLFFVRRRRDPAGRFLLVSFGIVLLAALGSRLHVLGKGIVPLPWTAVARQPVFDNVYTVRLMLYAFLAASVVVALWAASGARRWLRIGLPVLAAVALAPNLGHHHWDEELDVPAFVAGHDYERCLAPNENVLAIPYGFMGNSILWQALSGFRFRLEGGTLGPQRPPFGGTTGVRLDHDDVRPGDGGTVLQLARQRGVGAILVDPNDPYSWSSVLAGIGKPTAVGGLLLYRVGHDGVDPAACGAH
ncbi:MAG TPA: hypothetical protein VH063_18125 [Gaiellaceae bacterium]|jgi:hypothetical protein|nr:hypothetical protein [Gaiellaceae bacterium]